MKMKAIGIQGKGRVLVHVSGTHPGPDAVGRVVDLSRSEVYEENLLQSIIARGYWYSTVPKTTAERALALVEEKIGE